jgi:hypothetical protein
MSTISRWLCVGIAAAAVALAGGPVSAVEQSAALKQVIAAAQKEGKLELQWGLNANGNAAQVKQMGDAMNAMFGTTIAVRFTPGPSEPEMVNKVVIALAANLASPTDVVINSNQDAAGMYIHKAAVPIDWIALLPDRIQPTSVEADGTVIRVYTTVPGGIIYNTKAAPERPVLLTDLLKPEWKGKIASTPYATGWELLTATDVWGMDRALDFARKLSPQLAGIMRCSDLERVASGEFIAFAMNCGGRNWLRDQRNGAPVDYVVARTLRPSVSTMPRFRRTRPILTLRNCSSRSWKRRRARSCSGTRPSTTCTPIPIPGSPRSSPTTKRLA